MAPEVFRSPVAFWIKAYLETRRAAGNEVFYTARILRKLDAFLMAELSPGQPITREIAEKWIANMQHLAAGTRINQIVVLRQFCLYLSNFDPRTCIIFQIGLPFRRHPSPHIYSLAEVRQILAAARKIGPSGSFRPTVISTLIGFLYATGVRVGEALRLRLSEVDLKQRLIEIRKGKFKKSRYVPISCSTAEHLATYLRLRQQAGFSITPASFVFVTQRGCGYRHPAFTTIFLGILRSIGLRGPKGQRGPRIHDLRHTFAVNRLLAWYRQGGHLGAKLPILSTYMGHCTVTGTQIYLQATAELLESAGRRFHDHFAIPPFRKNIHGKN
jgi:integrase